MVTDPERLSAALKDSLTKLEEAYWLIKKIPLEPKKQNCIDLGEAVGMIIQVQKHLGDSYPELRVQSAEGQEQSEDAHPSAPSEKRGVIAPGKPGGEVS